ncbi:hypothetical protein [Zobellia uliginosa]|uniref:hypothetical protein n=1 Tax=Zobellia uliginosa TaxID=143224 RepID=UPI0026E1357D|nr:hypothetical protein [Zobellia uliginosa]MDO6517988.1 hypothetical protein [Zobellia uliginosa]
MGHLVRGCLRACLHLEFYETLTNTEIRVYKVQAEAEDFHIEKGKLVVLSSKSVSQKAKHLIGSGYTDDEGNYNIPLSDRYDGGPLEIDVVVTDKGKSKKVTHTVQFTLRRLNPVWRKNQEGKEFIFNYSFNFKFWNQVRTKLDIWSIIGHIRSKEDHKVPVKGVTVAAFDTDWINDDFLGSALTDSKGQFRIDYKGLDFKQTFLSPMIRVETPISSIPGPGVYFKIYSSEGVLLYEEDRNMGKTEERKNIPRCFDIDLYI